MNIRHLAFFSVIATTSIFSLIACNTGNIKNDQKNSSDTTLVIPVEVNKVNRGSISAYYSNTATLEAVQEANVVSKVRGLVQKIYFEEGDYVQKGEILAKIEDDQYRIEAERAKATMDRMFNDYQRNAELFDKDLMSAEIFENSRFEYESQKSAYELANLNYTYTNISSPIDGIISERLVKIGNMTGTDQQVFKVTNFDPIQAILYLPEHERAKIKVGQFSELKADALPNQLFYGKVERISPIIDPATGTFKVTIYMDKNQTELRPGMFSRVKIVYDTRLNAQMIPKSAIISEDAKQSVFIIKDSLAYKKEIRTGYINGVNIEVIEGLDDDDIVVTTGQGSLIDSTKVNIVSL